MVRNYDCSRLEFQRRTLPACLSVIVEKKTVFSQIVQHTLIKLIWVTLKFEFNQVLIYTFSSLIHVNRLWWLQKLVTMNTLLKFKNGKESSVYHFQDSKSLFDWNNFNYKPFLLSKQETKELICQEGYSVTNNFLLLFVHLSIVLWRRFKCFFLRSRWPLLLPTRTSSRV